LFVLHYPVFKEQRAFSSLRILRVARKYRKIFCAII